MRRRLSTTKNGQFQNFYGQRTKNYPKRRESSLGEFLYGLGQVLHEFGQFLRPILTYNQAKNSEKPRIITGYSVNMLFPINGRLTNTTKDSQVKKTA